MRRNLWSAHNDSRQVELKMDFQISENNGKVELFASLLNYGDTDITISWTPDGLTWSKHCTKPTVRFNPRTQKRKRKRNFL